nr:Chain A, GVTGIAQ segment from Superoxide dismutase [Cu-Zn] [Homo sapiens]
GVTGIAQ